MSAGDLLQTLLQRGLAEGAFPSAAAAVGFGGKMPVTACVGTTSLFGGTPVNEQTRYDMASLSKILGPTMIALRAIEEGLLTLDDTVGDFFDAPEDKKDITVRMLMTHTGGFEPAFSLEDEARAPSDVLRAILTHPLAGKPGEIPRYSCMGYILFAKMLEKLYQKPLNVLAKERVFDPLGMTSTGYLPEGGNIAATEISRRTGKLICGVVHDENARFQGGVSGNAGVFSNLEDMIRFADMLATGGGSYLSPATLAVATRNYTPGCESHRGLGFHLGGVPENFMGDLLGAESFGHTGFTGTSLVVNPQNGFYAVLLTNRVHPTRGNQKLFRFRRSFHNALYAELTREVRI